MAAQYDARTEFMLSLAGAVPAAWFALKAAPGAEGGIPGMLSSIAEGSWSDIRWCSGSLRTLFVFLLCYFCAFYLVSAERRIYMRGEEHGSAQWGSAAQLRKKYASAHGPDAILTENVRMGMDSMRHGRNLNTLVVGGSGSGKTRSYAKPNILSLCSDDSRDISITVLDPKGELVKATAQFLMERGYVVKVLDLINMERSHCYNPFVYLRDDNDIQKLVQNIMTNTTEGGRSHSSDPFWDRAASMLLLAIIMYLHCFAPPEEQNFSMVLDMIRRGEVKEDSDDYQSELDVLFERLEMDHPGHPAARIYRNYRSGSARTLKSIQITLLSRLEKFDLESLAAITCTDELELEKMGERKQALFAVISDNDPSFNFIVGMLYTQLFQQLYYNADVNHGGRLPVHVRFLMDEFATVAVPEDFDRILATMRSREISVAIIIQNLTQLKALFEKQWESIVGNCDEMLYLGGNEASTHEYISKMLGSGTIDTDSTSVSRGRSGSSSVSTHSMGRPLMTPDEVRMMDNRSALLFIRGERPVKDSKYDLMEHPLIGETEDGGREPYRHGEDTRSCAEITFQDGGGAVPDDEQKGPLHNVLILTEDEMYGLIEKKEKRERDERRKK